MNDTNNEVRPRKVIRISRKTLVVIIILIILVLIGYWAVSSRRMYSNVMTSSTPTAQYPETTQRMPVIRDVQTDITDTREFMKTSYSATIQSRDVQKVVTDVKNIVKGADGRIDNMTSSETNGYVSFVVAKSKFDAFRDEVEALTHRKLYSENVSSQNLLSTKQNIEEQTNTVVTALETLKSQKAALEQKHTQTITVLTTELYNLQSRIADVKTQIANATASTDVTLVTSWKTSEQNLLNLETTQRQKISSENGWYTSQRAIYEKEITSQTANLTSVQQQDTKFTNNIETVSGNVSVRWISIWQLITVFSPISPWWIILILVILIWWYLNHKKITPQIIIG